MLPRIRFLTAVNSFEPMLLSLMPENFSMKALTLSTSGESPPGPRPELVRTIPK